MGGMPISGYSLQLSNWTWHQLTNVVMMWLTNVVRKWNWAPQAWTPPFSPLKSQELLIDRCQPIFFGGVNLNSIFVLWEQIDEKIALGTISLDDICTQRMRYSCCCGVNQSMGETHQDSKYGMAMSSTLLSVPAPACMHDDVHRFVPYCHPEPHPESQWVGEDGQAPFEPGCMHDTIQQFCGNKELPINNLNIDLWLDERDWMKLRWTDVVHWSHGLDSHTLPFLPSGWTQLEGGICN